MMMSLPAIDGQVIEANPLESATAAVTMPRIADNPPHLVTRWAIRGQDAARRWSTLLMACTLSPRNSFIPVTLGGIPILAVRLLLGTA